MIRACCGIHFLQHLWLYPIIRIGVNRVFAFCRIKASLPCRCHSAVGFMDNPDTRVLGGVLVQNSRRSVCTAVIYRNDLKIRHRLRQNAVQTTTNILLCIVSGNNYGY